MEKVKQKSLVPLAQWLVDQSIVIFCYSSIKTSAHSDSFMVSLVHRFAIAEQQHRYPVPSRYALVLRRSEML